MATNYEVLVEQDESWPREIREEAYKGSMYEAQDNLVRALRNLFEPVIDEMEKAFDKAVRYLDD